MDIKNEILNYNVSRETLSDLEQFVELLGEWNNKMNLVSKNSMAEIWLRHVLDSMQLIQYIPQTTRQILDIGSGSGFPAVVLAIILKELNPKCKVTMVESITKKTVYLKDVCVKLGLNNTEVVNGRVENVVFKSPDIITARAVASLIKLCEYAFPICSKSSQLVLLKGKSYKDEIAEASKSWCFDVEEFENKYSSDGVVLKLSNLRKIK